jgi:hypothetical protein
MCLLHARGLPSFRALWSRWTQRASGPLYNRHASFSQALHHSRFPSPRRLGEKASSSTHRPRYCSDFLQLDFSLPHRPCAATPHGRVSTRPVDTSRHAPFPAVLTFPLRPWLLGAAPPQAIPSLWAHMNSPATSLSSRPREKISGRHTKTWAVRLRDQCTVTHRKHRHAVTPRTASTA